MTLQLVTLCIAAAAWAVYTFAVAVPLRQVGPVCFSMALGLMAARRVTAFAIAHHGADPYGPVGLLDSTALPAVISGFLLVGAVLIARKVVREVVAYEKLVRRHPELLTEEVEP